MLGWLGKNTNAFVPSLSALIAQVLTLRKTDPSATLNFDKDDSTSLDFVTAASNLRSHIFGIEEQTRFKVKEMAGNIIPAIATTNAIIAGMVVMEAFRILDGRLDQCRQVRSIIILFFANCLTQLCPFVLTFG